MPARIPDNKILGSKHGRLTIISEVPKTGRPRRFRCKCECGRIKEINLDSIRAGNTLSCGCLQKDRMKEIGKTNPRNHHLSKSAIYKLWIQIKRRCSENHHNKHRYADRGIEVCSEWINDFLSFNSYVSSILGPKPNRFHTIDRIDNNLGYAPQNIRWADMRTQQNNKNNNVKVEINGETKTITQWSLITGINRNAVYARIRSGWDHVSALTIPIKTQSKR